MFRNKKLSEALYSLVFGFWRYMFNEAWVSSIIHL